MVSADDVGQLEDRQEHTNNHAANNHTEEHNEDWFNQRGQTGKRGFNFFVEKVRNTFEHVVDFACLFAGGDHADDHVGKNRMFGQRHGNVFTALDVASGSLDGFFHD